MRKLFVSAFTPERAQELRGVLSTFGELSSYTVFTPIGARPYAHCEFRKLPDAILCKNTLHGRLFHEMPLVVQWLLTQSTISVQNLGPFVTSNLLQDAFSVFGPVEYAVVVCDPLTRKTRGKGFITFSTKEVAQLAAEKSRSGLFLFTGTPRPVLVEYVGDMPCLDGDVLVTDEGAQCETPAPHFAKQGTLEHDFAVQWQQLGQVHAAELQALADAQHAQLEGLYKDQVRQHEAALQVVRALEARCCQPPAAAQAAQPAGR
ncbi:putative Splicing factor [Paratrimastix pyriformis]|uniref:Splicing factor n=1 Tax=Paratrimastix pyriformis TaxID=342808 RepID=A0ABQ8UVK5_9EUKA|nr:putative Splicing factor [Paratrimastix pyriformis]